MIKITDAALQKILALRQQESRPDLGLRVAIKGRGPGGFQYELRFLPVGEKAAGDLEEKVGDLTVVVDAESAPHLKDASIDFYEDLHQSGFKIDNPNALWTDPVALAVQQVLDEHINPAVASHGGYVNLIAVEDGIAYVQLMGGCQGCGMADVTLKQGIETMIKEAVPEVREVRDSTDHASGTNPYYRPAKGGESPFA